MLEDDETGISIPPLTRGDIVYHVAGLTLNSSFMLWGIYWLIHNWSAAPPWLVVVTVILLSLFLSDFFSGLLHWGFDTWFTEESPYVGRMVLIVREHHIFPQRIFRYKFYYEAGAVSWASLVHTAPVVGGVTVALDNANPITFSAVVSSVIVSGLTLFMLQFHKLGHRRTKNPFLILLQKCHLLMSVGHHSQHHRHGHDRKYCLINGWADSVCDSSGFWRAAERGIQWATGAIPRHNDNKWMARYGRRAG